METSPKHLRETSEQAEHVDGVKEPETESPSKTQDDYSGKFFLKLIGAILIIVVVVAIGATSCGTAMQTVGTEPETNTESSQDSDASSDNDSGGSDSDSDGYSSTRDYSVHRRFQCLKGPFNE